MQQQGEGSVGEGEAGTVGKQFGDLMRDCRERKGWSQRQLAEMLHAVELRLDPSAITRIERGTRDVKLTEAIAIASVLGFDLNAISFLPEEHFRMGEAAQIQVAIRARKALLDAIRQIDRWVNSTDPETEEHLIEKRGLNSVVELYTDWLRPSQLAFKRGGEFLPSGGDNFAVYYDAEDRAVKQAIVDAVTSHILLSEDELDEVAAARRPPGFSIGSQTVKDDDGSET